MRKNKINNTPSSFGGELLVRDNVPEIQSGVEGIENTMLRGTMPEDIRWSKADGIWCWWRMQRTLESPAAVRSMVNGLEFVVRFDKIERMSW